MEPQRPFEFFERAKKATSQERMDEIIEQGLKELENNERFIFLQRVNGLKKDEQFFKNKLDNIDREGLEAYTRYDSFGRKFPLLDPKNRKAAHDYIEFAYSLAGVYKQLAEEVLNFEGDEKSSDMHLISAEKAVKRASNANYLLRITNSVSGFTYRETKEAIENMKDYFFLRRQSPITWRYEMNIRECTKGMKSAAKNENYKTAALLKERIDFLKKKKDELYEKNKDIMGKPISIPDVAGRLRTVYHVLKEKRDAEKFKHEHMMEVIGYEELWKKHDAAKQDLEKNLAAVEKTIEEYDKGKF